MTTPQQTMPRVPLVAQPIFLVDSKGNPLSLSTVASNINLNQVNGVAFSNTNPLFVDLVRYLGAAISASNPIASTLFDASGHQIAFSASGQVGISNFATPTDNTVLITSTALSATTDSTDQTNTSYRGVYVYIATGTFGSGASAITVTIQGKDPVSNKYYPILTSASLVASKDPSNAPGNILLVYPGCTATTNQSVSQPLPKTWRVEAAASAWGTGGSTLGVACGYLL
jgi:hypothetical protein